MWRNGARAVIACSAARISVSNGRALPRSSTAPPAIASRGGSKASMALKRSPMLVLGSRSFEGGVEDRPIAGAKGHESGWRGQQAVSTMNLLRRQVAVFRPAECLPAGDGVGRSKRRDHRAVRKIGKRLWYRVNELALVLHPLPVQYGIHVSRGGLFRPHRGCPGGTERSGRRASAKETRSMARGQRDRLVQEKELGPAPASHHRAAPALVIAGTNQPRLAGPALIQQRLRRGVMNDAAVTGEHPSLRDRHNVAERRDTVLQVHCLTIDDASLPDRAAPACALRPRRNPRANRHSSPPDDTGWQ